MLQRIQTVYLLVIVALMATTLFFPFAVLQAGNDLFSFDASGVSTMLGEKELLYPTWGLFVLAAVISIVALVTIFLFKRRILQIRLCVFNALLMLGFYGYFGYMAYSFMHDFEGMTIDVKFGLAFPLVCLILDYLAIRNIGADEALVRSLDRLR